MNLFLIDIDGALVKSDSVDLDCYSKAVEDVLGFRPEFESDDELAHYKSLTDAGRLDELMMKYQIRESRTLVHRKVESCYLARLNAAMGDKPQALVVSPGAQDFLTNIRKRKDTYVAIATGAWESVARLKLRAAGLDIANMTMASSSDALNRTEIMALAAFRSKQDSGQVFSRRVVFGQGTQSRHASQELGYDFVEVGGGTYSRNHIPNLAHYQAVYSQLSLQCA